ncbi:putative homocitrate synthase [Actinacidiphila reveromycinica]|uniref:Putative homocitrate synthase n=1 Tax=Actinacidiphila reveromycinica TaxID=659352 RepID=A0A7U3V0N7_9ACTN|nr:putative homocitrate synthase [Streptomyces sp. SN-593]
MNFEPQVLGEFDFPAPLRLIDSTLRKTLFTAGHTTSRLGFQRIAEALAELGVRDESINVTWTGADHPAPQDWALLQAIVEGGFPFRLNVYTDTLVGNGRDHQQTSMRRTVDMLAEAGVTTAAPGILEAPDDDAQKRQLDELADYFEYAGRAGLDTTTTFAQVGRRDFGRMLAMADHAVRLGARRLDLMDSTSSLAPEAMKLFVRRFRAGLSRQVPVTMHVHDEFGLATAGAIAAATAGAHPDVAMNGMSYRCGFAPLEEVVLALETLYGVDTGLHLERIQHVARVVARESGVPLPALKPLTGGYAYLKHMPGDVVAALTQGQGAFPPVSHGLVPARMGQEMTWVWGGLSSEGMVRALGARQGHDDLSGAEVRALRRAMDTAVAAVPGYPRWLDPQQAAARFDQALAGLRRVPDPERVGRVLDVACPHGPWQERVLARAGAGASAADLVDAAWQETGAAPVPDLVAMLAHCKPMAATAEGTGPDGTDDTGTDRTDGSDTDGAEGTRPAPTAREETARAALSRREESGVLGADDGVRRLIAELAAGYERDLGFRYVVSSAGLGAQDVLMDVRIRSARDEEVELPRARQELRTIIDNRLIQLLTLSDVIS